jgi:type II secretory pathway component GspD/PulD (secretin)
VVASLTATNNPPAMAAAGDQSPSMTASNESAVATAEAGGTNAPPALASTNETAAALSMTNASPNTLASNAIAEASSTNSPTAGGTNAPTAAAELPIQFQDVPITTAIESLARLANINYMLDPKIGYGQPDQNGQIKPEPTLSLRWENVTAQQALLALLDNYSLQLVENPKTGIAKITTKEPNALPPLITRVIQLKYASTSNMEVAVVGLLSDDKRSRVVPDDRTSQLVIVATDAEQSAVDTLLEQLDKPTRQVLIETKLVELSSNPSTKKGIDWSGTLQAQNVAFGNGTLTASTQTTPGTATPATTSASGSTLTPAGTSGSSIATSMSSIFTPIVPGFSASTAGGLFPDTGFLTADGVKAVLSFLNQSSEAQVVSTPRLVTLDNETATISVTTTFPIVNVTAGTANTTGGSSITYSNIGTILQVTPRITANDYIWLKVIPDVSSFAGTQTIISGGQPFQADTFESRHIETQVLIPNTHTLVMGGLVQDNPNASYTKVPILGDIPVLGLAFRSENKSMQKDNLLIFITPTIVQASDFRLAKTDFLGSQPQTMKDPMNPHTAWDSAQPRGDWSNPLANQASTTQDTSDANAAAAK